MVDVTVSSHVARPESPWLHGPRADLLLGAGAGYLLSLPLLMWLGSRLALTDWPIEITLGLGLLVSTPHYGATLLRVYERAEDRRRYRLFAVHASLVLAALFVAGLYWHGLGSFLMTLYFAWSPWHFAGQNYGLSLLFLRRRGVAVEPGAKRTLYAAYVLSFAIALLAFQAHTGRSFAPEFLADGRGYDAFSLGIPRELAARLAAVGLVAFLGCLAASAGLFVRAGARAADLVAPALLAASQSLWFVLPALFSARDRPLEGLAFTAVWASIAHSVQYLWITSYYARQSGAARRLTPYLGKALLAGVLIGELPALLFSPRLLGPLSWSGGLSILLFSVINLHHFVLDGAVWKLRDGRVAKLLLRSGGDRGDAAPRRRPALAFAVFSVAALCTVVPLIELWDAHAIRSRDPERLEAAARRLSLIGRDRIGVLSALAEAHAARGETRETEDAYRRALALRRDPTLMNNLAWTLAVHDGSEEAVREAVAFSEESVSRLGPRDAEALDTLAAAYAAAGRYADAQRTAQQALDHAKRELAAPIAARLALYREGRPYREP